MGVQRTMCNDSCMAQKEAPDLSPFVQRLKHAMSVREMGIPTLATKMDVAYQNVSQLKTEMGASFAVKAARVLEVNIEWLALGEGPMEKAPVPSAFAAQLGEYFDKLPVVRRAAAWALISQMLMQDRWPRLEDLQPAESPSPQPQTDPGKRPS